jgi:excisionase family DNA binding protein
MRLKSNQHHSLLDEDDLATVLKTSRLRIFKLHRNGKIPGYRLGKTLRFDLSEVLSALRNPNPRGPYKTRRQKKEEVLSQP